MRNEDPDETDMTPDDDDASTDDDTCPRCGAAVYDGVAQCPRCKAWLTEPRAHRRWVIVTAGVVLVTVVWLWYLRGL